MWTDERLTRVAQSFLAIVGKGGPMLVNVCVDGEIVPPIGMASTPSTIRTTLVKMIDQTPMPVDGAVLICDAYRSLADLPICEPGDLAYLVNDGDSRATETVSFLFYDCGDVYGQHVDYRREDERIVWAETPSERHTPTDSPLADTLRMVMES